MWRVYTVVRTKQADADELKQVEVLQEYRLTRNKQALEAISKKASGIEEDQDKQVKQVGEQTIELLRKEGMLAHVPSDLSNVGHGRIWLKLALPSEDDDNEEIEITYDPDLYDLIRQECKLITLRWVTAGREETSTSTQF